MNSKEVRWRQRYQNLDKAYTQLDSAIAEFDKLSKLEKEGLIQRFEYTFELGWKTIKDFLESQEVDASFPREVIKAAFHFGIIADGEVWMDMLEKRNLMAHTYDEQRLQLALTKVKDEYFDALTQVHRDLGAKL
jgi:nucleotidyltransferase substrate binding protein (TIGR01987 family)